MASVKHGYSDDDMDKIWSKATELNNNGYRLLTINRKKKHGGGLSFNGEGKHQLQDGSVCTKTDF